MVNDVDAEAAGHAVEEITAAGGRAVAEVAPVGTGEAAQALVDRAVDAFGGWTSWSPTRASSGTACCGR
nr:hypothetical protein GCM10020093_009500 [Planobispora longispora]